jgi:hypothetical protein
MIKIKKLMQEIFCIKILFCNQYFSLLNTLMRKGKDPGPKKLWIWIRRLTL